MPRPTAPLDDATLEWAARQVEASGLRDWRGSMARRKRQREDAEVRRLAREELRAELARMLRAQIGRDDLSPTAVLRRMAELPADRISHVMELRDAWPLAWEGLVTVECVLRCESNQVPPEMRFRITLTDAGWAALAAADQPREDRGWAEGRS